MEHPNVEVSNMFSVDLLGLNATLVQVETHASDGLPRVDIVGLAEACVKESKQRVRAAIVAQNWEFPDDKITINLIPPSVKKTGTSLDLAMAMGMLTASKTVVLLDPTIFNRVLMIGELSLAGQLRPVRGILSMLLGAKNHGFQQVILPEANVLEGTLVPGLKLYPARNLQQVVDHVTGAAPIDAFTSKKLDQQKSKVTYQPDLGQVKGQALAKSALVAAAAGGHNLIFVGPPGAGKTLIARCLPGILPPLNDQDSIETTCIHSCAGVLKEGRVRLPPFRAPHHSISYAGLMGGGKNLTPGEISLAHNGVLFFDELPEFQRNVLEMLREPLEHGLVYLARANGNIRYPARVQFVSI